MTVELRKYHGLKIGESDDLSLDVVETLSAGNVKVITNNVDFVVDVEIASGVSVAVGYPVFLETDGTIKPASSEPWGGSLGQTQLTFINHFLGVVVGVDGSMAMVDISPFTVHEFDFAASTRQEIGAWLGMAKSGGAALLDNKIEPALITGSCFRVAERAAGAESVIKVRAQSAYWGISSEASQ